MNKSLNSIFIYLSAVLFAIALLQKLQYSPDDTYIYLQYAKNIASGHGFSFNPGEQSYGVTSPLWVMFLTIPYFTGLDGFWFSKILDLVTAVIAIILFFRLSKIILINELTSSLAAAMFILNPWFIRWSFTGMETSFAVMLVVLIFLMWFRRKYYAAFFFCGLFYLTRPEGFLLTGILFIYELFAAFKEKRLIIKQQFFYIIMVSISVIPFLIYAKLTFGTFLPNTATGKSTLTISIPVIVTQIIDISKTLAGSSLPEMILCIIAAAIMIRKRTFINTRLFILWVAGLIALYIFTDADVISRYLLIITPFIILIGLSVFSSVNKIKESKVLILFIIVLFYSQFIFYRFVIPSATDFSYGLNECLVPVGKWFIENTGKDKTILVNDVGAIGYFSERYIIDAAALVNRDLELNRKIMSTTVDERLTTHRLLKYVYADYVIDRDTSSDFNEITFDNYRLKPEFMKMFPSLGLSDKSPRYFKVYKVNKIN